MYVTCAHKLVRDREGKKETFDRREEKRKTPQSGYENDHTCNTVCD